MSVEGRTTLRGKVEALAHLQVRNDEVVRDVQRRHRARECRGEVE